MPVDLCHENDIPEGGSRGFQVAGAGILAVKQDGHVFLYLNRCPHLGLPLEWEQDRFLDEDGALIRCVNHGALFVKKSGECIKGPCLGEALWDIDYEVADGRILIADEELPGPVP